MGKTLATLALVIASAACSSTPTVTSAPPWQFINPGTSSPIDKVDLLFAIDNSSSMADKQLLFANAIPALLGRMLNPNCIDDTSSSVVPGDGQGCKTIANTHPEFPPVRDLHIGIVSSSLGDATPDGTTCPTQGLGDATHQNDMGHLLNRTTTGTVANAKPTDNNGGNFLAWLPSSDPRNAAAIPPNVTPYSQDTEASQLVSDFQSLVMGVGQTGCGLEAQLESWYRFLIQPDPYDQIAFSSESPPRASLVGVDATLLKMRYDFLRPDSLVAIIQITDEEDSWSDPMWLGGYGWTSRTPKTDMVGGPGSGAGPRGTSECDVPVDNNPTAGPNNPDCVSCEFPNSNKPKAGTPVGQDPNCQQKPWYDPATPATPIATADGLNVRYASQMMRARYGYDNQPSIQRYVDGLTLATVPDRTDQTKNCSNPLFAAKLPDGSDTSSDAMCKLAVGSRTPDLVFYALIGGVPNDLVGNWTAMLGADPAHYIMDGIDPRMIQSTAPRAGVMSDWNTLNSPAGIDLEYACTFTLPAPRDCSAGNDPSCECNGVVGGPPLCDSQNPKVQTLGKAYPTIRELRVAQALGAQAVVGSICSNDYAPTMTRIVDTLGKSALSNDCLQPTTSGCELLLIYPNRSNQSAGCTDPGTSQPTSDLVTAFDARYVAALGDAGAAGSAPVVCVENEIVCPWNAPAGTQAILACPVAK